VTILIGINNGVASNEAKIIFIGLGPASAA